jgi:hypothetical protein
MKPTYTLHKLPQGFIATSDEDIRKEDRVLLKDKILDVLSFNEGVLEEHLNKYGNSLSTCYNVKVGHFICFPESLKGKKIIAQQDQIDFSALTEEEQKEIGWYDMDNIIVPLSKEIVMDRNGNPDKTLVSFGREIFQKAQELLSDRDVSHNILNHLCDKMDSISQEQIDKDSFQLGRYRTFKYVFDYIQSLSQKSWKIEIEHTCNGIRKEGESCTLNNKCTYPNCGKIKILKLC